MHLGWTKAGAAAHFPQAASEGNTPPGPTSLAKLLLQAQGRASQQLGRAGNAMKTSGDLQILIPITSKQTGGQKTLRGKTNLAHSAVGQLPQTDGTHDRQHHPAQNQAPPLLASILAFHFVL